MTHDLVTTFTNSLGKEHDWTYKNVNADLPVEQIKEACELLTQLDIFEKSGVKLFDTVVTAKIVTTYETEIFDETSEPTAPSDQIDEETQVKNEVMEKSAALPIKSVRSYDYLYNSSKNAIENTLEQPAETRSNHPSLILKKQTSGLKHTINENELSASRSTTLIRSQPEEKERLSKRKSFLTWLRRKKNRNKDDPDIHPELE
ncbi:DUF2922 domain-containing protein [Candidatus Enterococcus murrayae]|uniref:DUF2922 domain-containing protein n=1 Tax=Candidatus Enterococcus murrayae TaxID=2815321 RepID=A0ABS3HMC8_9ENTE|nr:DUF2922 domain-containing protein [Enterococcus sp. MJM16]MBO0454612.1 DUF2922 domain-containing protein [Enterococcus sp. MJM16]